MVVRTYCYGYIFLLDISTYKNEISHIDFCGNSTRTEYLGILQKKDNFFLTLYLLLFCFLNGAQKS
jgi:hypothetical protein